MGAALETRIEIADSIERTRIVVSPLSGQRMLIYLQLGDLQAVSLYVATCQAKEILARLELWLRPFVFEESIAANG